MDATLDRRSGRRGLIRVTTQSLLAIAVVLVTYYVAPNSASIVVGSAVCVVAFLVVVAFELRAVVRNPQPVARAAVAMARVVPLFIVSFAWGYLAMSTKAPGTFSEPLTKSGALYFTITVLSTVGFGDITPVTDAARLTVSAQMICDLVVIGIIVKLIVGVAKTARARKMGAGSEGIQPSPGQPSEPRVRGQTAPRVPVPHSQKGRNR
jgi:voltage-gated potassium channel